MTVEDTPVPDTARPRRREQRRRAQHALLEAAVTQLAESGLRGLTHRKVEQRAHLAQGSAKYYFGTLDALIEATLNHLADLDLPLVLDVSDSERREAVDTPEDLYRRAQAVAEAMLARPERVRARLHLYLDAAGNPQRRAIVAAAKQRLIDRIAQSLPGPHSSPAAKFVAAVVDGILLDQASVADPEVRRYAARYLLAAGSAGLAIAAEPARPNDH